MTEKQIGKDIKDKIAKVCREVVLQEDIEKFKSQILQQLKEARQKKLYWIKKEISLEASLATCEHILKLPEINKEVEHHE